MLLNSTNATFIFFLIYPCKSCLAVILKLIFSTISTQILNFCKRKISNTQSFWFFFHKYFLWPISQVEPTKYIRLLTSRMKKNEQINCKRKGEFCWTEIKLNIAHHNTFLGRYMLLYYIVVVLLIFIFCW